jgi:hypothetical protein
MANTPDKKTDVLNLRLDPGLAAEIERIANWRGSSASEVARELMRHGVTVERQLEAQELHRPYEYSKIDRNPDQGFLKIDARWVWYTPRQIAEMEADHDEMMGAA